MRDDDNKLQVVAQSQFDMLLACGYTKPIVHLTHKDIPGTPHNHFEGIYSFMSVSLFQNIVKGLQDSRVLEGIHKFPDFPRPLFVFKDQERLTAGIINPRCACTAWVTVYTWFVCLCVCLLPHFLPLGATKQPIRYAVRCYIGLF